jgi:hypothetical protein
MVSTALINWEQSAVQQCRPKTGCIPTGYEMLLRAAGATGINFATFQDDFDLDKDLNEGELVRNNFVSVATAVQKVYPKIKFRHVQFEQLQGMDKLNAIEEQIGAGRFVLISIALIPFGGNGWHIMPVVNITDDKLMLLKGIKDCNPETCLISKDDFIMIHNTYHGGNDIAYLEFF